MTRKIVNFNSTAIIAGKEYNTVKIGDQIWMAENLDIKVLNDGTSIEELKVYRYENESSKDEKFKYWKSSCEKKKPICCALNFNLNNEAEKFGYLYNYYCIKEHYNIEQDQWRLPSVADFEKLINCVGGSQNTSKLKSTYGWYFNSKVSNNGTDDYGFCMLPGGFIWNEGFGYSYDEVYRSSNGEPIKHFDLDGTPLGLEYYTAFRNADNCAKFWTRTSHLLNDNDDPTFLPLAYERFIYNCLEWRELEVKSVYCDYNEGRNLGCSVRLIWDPNFYVDNVTFTEDGY